MFIYIQVVCSISKRKDHDQHLFQDVATPAAMSWSTRHCWGRCCWMPHPKVVDFSKKVLGGVFHFCLYTSNLRSLTKLMIHFILMYIYIYTYIFNLIYTWIYTKYTNYIYIPVYRFYIYIYIYYEYEKRSFFLVGSTRPSWSVTWQVI